MPGYWNAHSDRDWEDQLHEPPDDEDGPDHDPQPRWIFWPTLADDVLKATKALYPEARIPETPMTLPEAKRKYEHAIDAARFAREERLKRAIGEVNAAYNNAQAEAWLIYLQDAGLDK